MVKITGDTAQYVRSLETAQKKAGRFADTAGKVIRTGALVGGAAVLGLGIAATKMAADFESSMSEVATLMPGISDKAFGKLKQDVLDFSKEMGIATDQAVPALYQAISAGVPKENVMEFMTVASKAAIGGVTDLETAVDGITSVVNAYGSEVIDAQRAADIMFTGVKLGKTDFEQLSKSLFQVIPTASSLGVSFEEVTAALATMTAQGVPTSVAATQLRQAFVEASKGGSKLDKAIREMAGKGFAELIGEGETATDILEGLRGSMPEQEFKDLFGSVEAMNAVLQITGPNVDSMRDSLAQAGTSAGAVDAAFSTVSETASFKFGKAMNMLKVMMIEAGSVILPIVADVLTKQVIPALERFSAWFTEHKPQIESAIKAISSVVGDMVGYFKEGLDTIMPPLKALAEYIYEHKPLMIAAIAAIGAAVVVAFGPGAAALAAIVGLIMVIGYLRENWREVADAIVGKLVWLKDTFLSVINDFKNALADHWTEIVTVALAILFPPGAGLFALVTNSFGLQDKVLEAFRSLRDMLFGLFWDIVGEARRMGERLLRWMWEGIQSMKDWFIDKLEGFKDAILGILDPRNWFSTPAEHYAKVFGAVPGAVADALNKGLPTVRRAADSMKAELERIAAGPSGGMGAEFSPALAVLGLPKVISAKAMLGQGVEGAEEARTYMRGLSYPSLDSKQIGRTGEMPRMQQARGMANYGTMNIVLPNVRSTDEMIDALDRKLRNPA